MHFKKGDQKTVLAIQREDGDTFYQRWLRYIEEVKAENRRRAASEVRAGPDNATRRKLREKRKKKN